MITVWFWPHVTHEFKNISTGLYTAQSEKSIPHDLEYWSNMQTLSVSVVVFLSQSGNKGSHEPHLAKCLNQSLDVYPCESFIER